MSKDNRRRSPRLNKEIEDNFTTPPETPECYMDTANDPLKASISNAEKKRDPSTTEMPTYTTDSASSTVSTATNGQELVVAPASQEDAMAKMQMRIEELERLLKCSVDLQSNHSPMANTQRNSQSTSQPSSDRDLPCQNRQLQFESTNNPVVTLQCSSNLPFSAVGNSITPNVIGGQTNMSNTFGSPQNYSFPRKLLDLPHFDGEAEVWPMFSVAYHQSTNEYRYTDFENCQRLQKSLRGRAFDTVKSLLIHPENVSSVMEQLEFYFGRPEILVASQIKSIREVPSISETAIEKFISFATKSKNLSVFLKSAGANQHLANPTLIGELVSKLPMSRKIEWARYSANIKPYPTVENFSDWMNETARIMCSICDLKPEQSDVKKRTVMCTNVSSDRKQDGCFLCGKDHRIYKCVQFIEKNVNDRWADVKRLKLCFACLGKGHSSRECNRRRECSYPECKRTHNRLLHENISPMSTPRDTAANNQPVLNCTSDSNVSKLLFRVVAVTLYGPKSEVSTYALLDDGSSVSLIDKSLMTELGLVGKSSSLALQLINGNSAESATSISNVFISGKDKKERHLLKDVYAIDKLNLPVQSLNPSDLEEFSSIMSTLPVREYRNARPRVLIGLDNYHLGLANETILLRSDGPFVTNTKLGWTVFGRTCQNGSSPACLHIHTDTEQSMDEMMADYLSTESFGVRPAPIIEGDDDTRARRILEETTQKINGRFQTGLLWKEGNITLPDSLPMAMKRLYNIEKKMDRDDVFAAEYRKTIESYVEKGYARKLTQSEVEDIKPNVWYLPHFAVVNPNKPRKLRLVFDAAAKVDGVSLNSFLLKGPQEYQPLPSVIFKFRLGSTAVCADIKEMFHRIYIRPEDRCAQRFLWRDGCQDRPPEVYEMMVMTFGAACSPCSAQYVKETNAKSHTHHDPRAIEAILDNHYVDDFVDSFESDVDAIRVSGQVREIHSDAGFELRGFISNSKEVVNALNGNQTATNVINGDALSTEKVLGMFWFPEGDTFRFRLQFNRVDIAVVSGERVPTKRELLSIIMSVFDPLGFLGHLMIVAKLIMREVWRCKVQWDESVPNYINAAWLNWKGDLDKVTEVEVPRHYFRSVTQKHIEIHVFVDASESAYAAVAYWKYFDDDGNAGVSFICSKSRCAPMKQLSVPRMELQAAVLGVRLMQTIKQAHQIRVEGCILWTDSTTVIKWIRSTNRRYKQFVAHRVNEILDATGKNDWRWVPTQHNLADEATRLRHDIDINSDSRWFTGPEFLKSDPRYWPVNSIDHDDESDDMEVVKGFTLLVNHSAIDTKRFSSYIKLKRVTAWVLRFIDSCKGNPPRTKFLLLSELQRAEIILIRQAQDQSYAEEIQQIEKGNTLAKESTLRSLMPYRDVNCILRVGGRLEAASWMPYEIKHPIILHPDHDMTKLIVREYHEKFIHQNHEATIAEIRQRFWIPRVRQVLRSVVGSCTKCKIDSAKPMPPLMGQLPADRLTPYVRPFTYTGLDYFGPINITIGRRQEKRWVALFTCLTVRAVHLEVAFDLSTDACILAIRNFINRRGTPIRMRSDNGKNFIGLDGDTKQFAEVFDCDRIQNELSSRNVQWIFNCPLNPSEGGVWERMVKSVKRVLRQTMNHCTPREHTLQSFLIEAENVVNSRPLTHVPVSSYDDDPITPNHFLLGVANTSQTPSIDAIDPQPKVLRKQWRIARQMRDHFWKRWIVEYLPTLTRREKWCEPRHPIRVDDIVLICDVNVPRKEWLKGRVQKVIPGSDGTIRRAEVRTVRGVFCRPVSKLAILDVISGESN